MGSVKMRKPIICQRILPKLTISLMAATLILCLVFSPQTVKATLTVIQPSNADTYLNSIQPNVNNDGYAAFNVGVSSSVITRGLVKFDLSSIPLGSTINTASLMLYGSGRTGDPTGRTYAAYRVTKDWIENQATWNSYRTGILWDTAGGDFSTDGASSTTVPSSIGWWMNWDVTTIVKAWIENGQPNYGFLILDLNEVVPDPTGFINFDSKESIFESWRPILEIDWSESAPTVEPAPVGGISTPTNKLEIVTPYIALAGIFAAISTVYVIKKRKD